MGPHSGDLHIRQIGGSKGTIYGFADGGCGERIPIVPLARGAQPPTRPDGSPPDQGPAITPPADRAAARPAAAPMSRRAAS